MQKTSATHSKKKRVYESRNIKIRQLFRTGPNEPISLASSKSRQSKSTHTGTRETPRRATVHLGRICKSRQIHHHGPTYKDSFIFCYSYLCSLCSFCAYLTRSYSEQLPLEITERKPRVNLFKQNEGKI